MIKLIKKLYTKYRELIMYGIFGVLTTLFNIVLYIIMSQFIPDLAANTIAFILAVIFAYWTNCRFVFKDVLSCASFFKFVGMRIGTLLIDDGGMWLLLNLNWDKILAKIAVNVVVIVLNYVFSKLFIFAKETAGKEKYEENDHCNAGGK